MIELIFTLDYEIYGDGTGRLKELMYEPTERLRKIFQDRGLRFVAFVEVAELQRIERFSADSSIDLVHRQIRVLYELGHEIGLHIHPQWCRAQYQQGRWFLNFAEYNLCELSEDRIRAIVTDSVEYLKCVVQQPGFAPLSFRAGNWLFQPTETAARVLWEKGLRIDSSVFKGGFQRVNKLDYRRALANGAVWRFGKDVTIPDQEGSWIEIPIHVEMVRPWRMSTPKRMSFSNELGGANRSAAQKIMRALDFARLKYPLKLDFCRMTYGELTTVVERIIRKDGENPETYYPVVAIGHSKDLWDFGTVERFLEFLSAKRINISTLADAYTKLSPEVHSLPSVPA